MTSDQFRDAIAKGLGRMIQYLRADPSDPHLDIIREACTHWLGYDLQVDDPRSEYLLEIIRLSGHGPELRKAAIAVLRESEVVDDQ